VWHLPRCLGIAGVGARGGLQAFVEQWDSRTDEAQEVLPLDIGDRQVAAGAAEPGRRADRLQLSPHVGTPASPWREGCSSSCSTRVTSIVAVTAPAVQDHNSVRRWGEARIRQMTYPGQVPQPWHLQGRGALIRLAARVPRSAIRDTRRLGDLSRAQGRRNALCAIRCTFVFRHPMVGCFTNCDRNAFGT
jgi:hypothetical protein